MIDFMSGSEHDLTVPAGPEYRSFPTRPKSVQVDAEAVLLVGQDGLTIPMPRKKRFPRPSEIDHSESERVTITPRGSAVTRTPSWLV